MKKSLTIIIASTAGESALAECLRALLPDLDQDTKIIVVPHGIDGGAEHTHEYVAHVRFLPNSSLPAMLASAVELAQSDLIAFTDSTCVPSLGWVNSVRDAHADQSLVIGGSVEMGDKYRTFADWAAFFCDYAQFMSPASPGVVNAVPGNNFSVKREALAIGQEFVKNEFWKSLWCSALISQGFQLISIPSISVKWEKRQKAVEFLSGRYTKGRDFAAARTADRPALNRIPLAIGSLVLPLLMIARSTRTALIKRRYLLHFLASFPVIAAAAAAWAAGELVGYIVPRSKVAAPLVDTVHRA